MVVTVLCAGFTVVFFIISNVNEAQWKFGEEESTVELSSKCQIYLKGRLLDLTLDLLHLEGEINELMLYPEKPRGSRIFCLLK